MFQEKARKILFVMIFFSLSAMITSSYDNMDSNQKSSAFAQTTNPPTGSGTSPVPENNYVTIGNGPIPEDNSTNLGNGPIPEDNSINPPDWQGSDNLTNSGLPNDTSPTVDNAISQGPIQTNPTAIPEFGLFAPVILIIAISSIIIFRMKSSS